MHRRLVDFWVGVFVAAGFLAIVFLALKVSSNNSVEDNSSYRLVATFGNVGGLKVRAPVKSAGVVVGRVVDIRLNEQQDAEVLLAIESKHKYGKDSSAEILTSGLLGEQYIGLESVGDVALKNGDKIVHSSDAMVLERLISAFMFNKAQETESSSKQENDPLK